MTKRVLFVDDEPNILEGLRNLLHRQRRKWEMLFVQSGGEALKVLDREPIDVIVTDMCMPGMDGAALLKKAQELYPRSVRIVLSGHSELEAAMRAVPVAHQFLCKPCEPGVIENVVERACNLQSLMSEEAVRRIVGRIGNLPSLPRVYSRLTAALGTETVSASDIARILKQDMAICAKVLQMVNSAFFRLQRTISGIEEAVAYLGFNTIRRIVLAIEVFRNAHPQIQPKISLEALQAHALLVADLASSLQTEKRGREDAFVAGLLHDIGKLVLAVGLPAHFDKAIAEMEDRGCSMYIAEQRVSEVTHAEVGGYLLGLWGLPHPIVEAVASHHVPSRVDAKEFGILATTHIANALIHDELSAMAGGSEQHSTPLDLGYVEAIGVAERLPEWRELARQRVATGSD
jgi:HD-like signal output (HDOD) protein